MKDNEIIETWQKIQDILRKTENVVLQKDAIGDFVRHITNALDLLNRLQADNERLKNAYKQVAWERDIFAEDMKEEIKKDCSYLMLDIKTIKAEAYKRFAERLKICLQGDIRYDNKILFECDIDNILKELVGEDNAKDND